MVTILSCQRVRVVSQDCVNMHRSVAECCHESDSDLRTESLMRRVWSRSLSDDGTQLDCWGSDSSGQEAQAHQVPVVGTCTYWDSHGYLIRSDKNGV